MDCPGGIPTKVRILGVTQVEKQVRALPHITLTKEAMMKVYLVIDPLKLFPAEHVLLGVFDNLEKTKVFVENREDADMLEIWEREVQE